MIGILVVVVFKLIESRLGRCAAW